MRAAPSWRGSDPPALAKGEVVLCERSCDSTTAYQGTDGSDLKVVQAIIDVAVGETWPDLTLAAARAPRRQRAAAAGPPTHTAPALQARPDGGSGPEFLRAGRSRLSGHRRRRTATRADNRWRREASERFRQASGKRSPRCCGADRRSLSLAHFPVVTTLEQQPETMQ